MSAPVLEQTSVDEQLRSLTTVVRQLRQELHELRCDVAYWKSMHARAVERNTKLQAELDQAKAEIRRRPKSNADNNRDVRHPSEETTRT